MQSSLGIFVGERVIKYAKVSKEKNNFKLDAHGVVFPEGDITDEINKIIIETASTRVPVSIKVLDEQYHYFDVFGLLDEKALKSAAQSEFEIYCDENDLVFEDLASRFYIYPAKDGEERRKVLYVSTNEKHLNENMKKYSLGDLKCVIPLPLSMMNLLEISSKDRVAIVNIEESTDITIVSDGEVIDVQKMEMGLGSILDLINETENSMSESYAAYKNTTISNRDIPVESDENPYAAAVMPILNKIAKDVKSVLDGLLYSVDKVYLTGSAALLNNIDIYFQEMLPNVKCEILKPFLAEAGSLKVSMNDYIEASSPISLALSQLGVGMFKDLNFRGKVKIASAQKAKSGGNGRSIASTQVDLGGPLDATEKMLLRGIACVVVAIFAYMFYNATLNKEITEKNEAYTAAEKKMNIEMEEMDADITVLSGKATQYRQLTENLQEMTGENTAKDQRRLEIPNLLWNIMNCIPERANLVSIENDENNHMIIEVESMEYDAIGYFKSQLVFEEILKNVKSTAGIKVDGFIQVTIEGDLNLED